METLHRFYYADARNMGVIPDSSVHLVVTSPPYPMISMWDQVFRSMKPAIATCLDEQDGFGAYDLMHVELSKVWGEVYRTLVPGGIACINIGDATRTIDKRSVFTQTMQQCSLLAPRSGMMLPASSGGNPRTLPRNSWVQACCLRLHM